jgi:hypothetical protein
MAGTAPNSSAPASTPGEGNAPPVVTGTPASGAPSSPATPPSVTPKPETPAVPAGMRLVKDEDWQVRERALAASKGQGQFYEAARAAGFTKPEDFARLSKISEAMKSKGLDFDKAADLVLGAEASRVDPEDIDLDDLATKAAERAIGTIRQKDTEAKIRSEHESSQAREKSLLESTVEELAGKGATEADKALVRDLVEVSVFRTRSTSFYEDGHPLASEDYKPLGEAEFGVIKTTLAERLKLVRGRSLEALADSTLRTPGSVPNRNLGAPPKPSNDRLPGRSGPDDKRNQIAEWADKRPALSGM